VSLARAAALAAVVLACGHARAGEPEGRVHLSFPSCELPKLAPDEIRAAVALELTTSGLTLLPEDEPPNAGDIEASVGTNCSEDGVLELRATWDSKDGTRVLKLRELPAPARPRAVALALAELLAALRPDEPTPAIEVELDEDPAPTKDAATSVPARPPTARPQAAGIKTTSNLAAGSNDDVTPRPSASAPPRGALTFQGEVRSFSLEPIVLGARAAYEFNRFVLGVALLRGSAAGNEGSVTAAITNGYFDGRLQELGRRERPWFTFGPRLGVGLISLSPIPRPSSAGTSSTDVYAEVAQFCEFWATLPPFRFGTQLELGYAMGALAYETDRRLASYGGAFGSVLLDVTLLL
jgi:hypothetical protein